MTTMDRQDALSLAVRYAIGCGVPGDMIEFGCWKGESTVMIARAMCETARKWPHSDHMHKIGTRNLWVFDSFEGFPAATEQADKDAPHIKSGAWSAGQPAGGSPDAIRRACGMWISTERILIKAGWFKDTLSSIPPGARFALVHIDCDYYESTKQVLDHLLGKDLLSDGCTILFDDWYCNRGSPEFGEQRAWQECTTKYPQRWSDWGPYDFAGRRLIVHR